MFAAGALKSCRPMPSRMGPGDGSTGKSLFGSRTLAGMVFMPLTDFGEID
jgi:hypothetical protein